MTIRTTLLHAALAIPLLSASAAADDVADFYKGKTISFVVSTDAGGGYDIYARPLSRHMGKHIPGNPTIVVQNMVGAGGMRATNHLYTVAPRDGTAIGMIHNGVALAPLQGQPSAKFDATRFNWIGSMNKAGTVCLAWHTAPVKSLADTMQTEFVVGSTGPGSGFFKDAVLLKNLFGAKLKIISGYKGGLHLLNSIEREEIHGTCGIAFTSITVSHPHWLRDKLIRFIAQSGLERDPRPELANVPAVMDLAKTDEQKAVLSIMFASGHLDRPVLAPPDLPAARVAALRAALKATLEDKEFLAETGKMGIPIVHVPGQEIQDLLARLYKSPPSVLAAVQKAMTP
jgi:tripartite-type tricarboxylate transporter receptor subunit TctC